jgi:tetratricopeptide (TPR) repeat protein
MQRLQGEAALRAVELDPGLAVAHLRLAGFYEETSDSKKAEEHNHIARTLDPNDPLILGGLAGNAVDEGDIDKAIAIQRRVEAQDPLNGVVRQNLAVFLMADGQFDEAMSEFRSVLELNPDAGLDVEIELVRLHALQGQDTEALAAASRMPKGKYRDHGLALLYRAPGHRVESDAAYARLLAQQSDVTEGVGSDIMDEIRLAEVQAFRGLDDAAFATLDGKKAALFQKWGTTAPAVWYLQHESKFSPFLKRLHADPRWGEFSSPPG